MPIDLTAAESRTAGPTLAAAKACGDCNLCCKVLKVNAVEKPAGLWCRHLVQGAGCSIHALKPIECSRFQCFWTVSEELGEEWRPIRSKLVLWSNVEGRLIVDVDPSSPGAWRREPYYSQLKAWADRSRPGHLEVLVRVKGRLYVVFPEEDVDLGPERPHISVASGYLVEAGRRTPYARFVEAPPAGATA